MLFPTHLIGGYVSSRLFKQPVVLVVLGAALPDIIDKPLGILEVANYYHSVGHSIFTVLLLILVGIKFRQLIPIALGWTIHILQDALHILVNRGLENISFMFYPLLFPDKPEITNGSVNFVSNFLSNYLWSIGFYTEFIFWILALYFVYSSLLCGDN